MKNAACKLYTAGRLDTVIGAGVCGLAAAGASAVAAGRSWQNLVPLVFIVILLAIAGIFGARAGILGTLLATLVFASVLFGSTGSITVASDSARSNLGWMLLIGIAFSFLFAPPTSGFRRH